MRQYLAILGVAALVGCAGEAGTGSVNSPAASTAGSRQVTGIDGVKGEIIGTLAPGSTFNRVQVGMGRRQVQDIIGVPQDHAIHITGKAFIPFYFGGDTHAMELFYKSQGQLTFVPNGFGSGVDVLVRIINDPSETGYAH